MMPSLKTEREIRHNCHICHLSRNINVFDVAEATQDLSRHLSRTAQMVLWLLKSDRFRDGWVTDTARMRHAIKVQRCLRKLRRGRPVTDVTLMSLFSRRQHPGQCLGGRRMTRACSTIEAPDLMPAVARSS
jgi:hypothetical protein